MFPFSGFTVCCINLWQQEIKWKQSDVFVIKGTDKKLKQRMETKIRQTIYKGTDHFSSCKQVLKTKIQCEAKYWYVVFYKGHALRERKGAKQNFFHPQ